MAKDLMNKLHVKGKSTPKVTRLDVVEWFVDAGFEVEVRVHGQPEGRWMLKGIRKDNHGIGVPIHRLNAGKRSGLWPETLISCPRCGPNKDKARCVCSLSTTRKASAEQPR